MNNLYRTKRVIQRELRNKVLTELIRYESGRYQFTCEELYIILQIGKDECNKVKGVIQWLISREYIVQIRIIKKTKRRLFMWLPSPTDIKYIKRSIGMKY